MLFPQVFVLPELGCLALFLVGSVLRGMSRLRCLLPGFVKYPESAARNPNPEHAGPRNLHFLTLLPALCRWLPTCLGTRWFLRHNHHRRIMPVNKILSGLALLLCSSLMANGRCLGQAQDTLQGRVF